MSIDANINYNLNKIAQEMADFMDGKIEVKYTPSKHTIKVNIK